MGSLGFEGLGCRASGLGFEDLGFRASGLGFEGSECREWGLGLIGFAWSLVFRFCRMPGICQ